MICFEVLTVRAQSPHTLSTKLPHVDRYVFEKHSTTGDFGRAKAYDKLPLSFATNLGQTDAEVSFTAEGDGYNMFLTRHGVLLALRQSGLPSVPLKDPRSLRGDFLRGRGRRISAASAVLGLNVPGASLGVAIVGMDELPGKNNYFIGNDSKKWRTGVPTYSRVKYQQIYPGVDLVFYGNPQRLEYDFIVAPHADPSQLSLSFGGASKVRIDSEGNLRVSICGGEVVLRKPIIYQQNNKIRHEITGGYILEGHNTARFEIGPYDHDKTLVVDPVLDYSTYLGGSSDEFGFGIAVDSNGDAFVAGQTASRDFPTTSHAIQTANNSSGGGTVFVTEINPTGTGILYSTYLGGSTSEQALRIALDSSSPANVYITGLTCSNNFPTTSNAYLPTLTPAACTGTSGGAGFATKFNPALSGLSALIYSTYLGGNGGSSSGGDAGESIAVDATGNMYVAGATYSTNFPTTSGAFQGVNHGGGNSENAFVSRIDPTKSGAASLVYSTYLGGSSNDIAFGIAVDSSGNAYITGEASSTDFPTTASAFLQTYPGVNSLPAFVARLDTTASGSASLVYSTYLGGSQNGGDTGAYDISLGPSNVAYVTGFTLDADYPVTPGAYLTSSSLANVATLSLIDTSKAGANSLTYSTFLGGSQGNGDAGTGLKADSQGNAYIAGYTFSSTFPVTSGAYQTSFAGCATGFVSKLMPSGNGSSDLAYSTFFGGTEPSSSCTNSTFGTLDIALDSNNNVYVAGVTAATNFPVSPGNAYQTALNGPSDAYVAKLSLSSNPPLPTITSLSVRSGTTGTSVTISGTNFNMNQGSGTVTFGGANAFVDSWSSTSIVVLVPSEGTPGSVHVVVHTSSGASNSKTFSVIPSITLLSPSSGPVGASVTISGYNFGSTGTVTFNGVSATTTSWSSSTVVAKVPSGAATGNVIVTSNSTPSPSGTVFTVVPTPTITSLSVSSGTAGTPVTISGTSFGSTQPSEAGAVVIGGSSAFVTSWSASSIVALVPNSAAPGSGSVTVTVGGVQSNADHFTVNPSLNSIAPYAGPAGESIVISGANFGSAQNGGTVKFGTSSGSVSVWSSTAITVAVPNLAAGAFAVNVTAASIATNSVWFTVTGASGTAPPAAPPIPGLPAFASFGGGPDQIDLGNLNVHLDIPVYSRPGRGTPFSYTLKYDSSVYYPTGAAGSVKWQPVNNWGWAGQSSVVFGSVSYVTSVSGTCSADSKQYTIYYGWSYQDKFGVTHPFNAAGVSTDANCGSTSQTGIATDGSGYTLLIASVSGTLSATVTSKAGRQFNPPVNGTGGAATRRVSTTLRQVLTEFSELFLCWIGTQFST
jgi:hypothetical protein